MPQWVVVTTRCNDDDDKEADDSYEECLMAVERDFMRMAHQPNEHLEKLLEAVLTMHTPSNTCSKSAPW
jgi:hypothetical protein